jgi:hypothetical protein
MEIAKLKTQAQGKEREIAEEEARIAELQKAQKDVSGCPPFSPGIAASPVGLNLLFAVD